MNGEAQAAPTRTALLDHRRRLEEARYGFALLERKREVADTLLGAGSVRRAEQIQQVVDAGATFAVSPGATESVLDAAANADIPFIPGAATPSEIMRLLERGYVLQKFFPAELSGGIAQLQALRSPLPEARFFPTGGITPKLAPLYLGLDAVLCIGGSWIAPARDLRGRDFANIEKLAANAAKLAARHR